MVPIKNSEELRIRRIKLNLKSLDEIQQVVFCGFKGILYPILSSCNIPVQSLYLLSLRKSNQALYMKIDKLLCLTKTVLFGLTRMS